MATTITRNFTLEELTASTTAKARKIRNIPDTQAVVNLCVLAAMVLQPLRDWWGKPVTISSGYRCRRLNQAVGGVSNSQHLVGQAADIDIAGDTHAGRMLFLHIRDCMDYDQLIWEHDRNGTYWVHVSYNAAGNRRQVIDNLTKI